MIVVVHVAHSFWNEHVTSALLFNTTKLVFAIGSFFLLSYSLIFLVFDGFS